MDRSIIGRNVRSGSQREELRLRRTSPLVPLIADIRTDIVFRRFGPEAVIATQYLSLQSHKKMDGRRAEPVHL
jgi:hypothetical protein